MSPASSAGYDMLLRAPAFPEPRRKLRYRVLKDDHYAYLVAEAAGWQSIVAHGALALSGLEAMLIEQARLEMLQLTALGG